MLCKKGVLRNFAKFTRKQLRQRLYLNKVAEPILKHENLGVNLNFHHSVFIFKETFTLKEILIVSLIVADNFEHIT